MRLATFNCNSVRTRLDIILAWLEQYRPDALALQETKVTDDLFPAAAFADAGWHVVFRGEKSYNGVALVTREPARDVSFGLGDDDGASETRLVHARVGDVHVVNAYVPQGRALDSDAFQFKRQWLGRMRTWFAARFDPKKDRVAWVGDLNVAPTPLDVYAPDRIWPHVCFCQEILDDFAAVVGWGLVDVFRKHLPEPGVYTFWDYRQRGTLERNLGWRIDHILATAPLAKASRAVAVDVEPRRAERPSDHTFVYADFGPARK